MLDSGNYGILRTDGKLDTSSVTITASFLAKLAFLFFILHFQNWIDFYVLTKQKDVFEMWLFSKMFSHGKYKSNFV